MKQSGVGELYCEGRLFIHFVFLYQQHWSKNMLSSTYIQVAMQVENDRFRQELDWLKSRAESMAWQGERAHEELETFFQVVSCFQRKCCSRRVEKHFLPELRKWAGRNISQMAEHDALHQLSMALHALVCRLLERQISGMRSGGKLLQKHIRVYCRTVMQMLDEEETLVFSLARDYFHNENWIYLAGIFMQEESDGEELLIVHEPDRQDEGLIYQTSAWHCPGAGICPGVFQYA